MMGFRSFTTIAIVGVLSIAGLLYATGTQAQPATQTPVAQMMGPGSQGSGMTGTQQMPMGQMMMQMQQQMGQMASSLQAMRARLNKINPALLTPAERDMYEYLKVLQTHMETMQMWAGNAQGVMRQMPAPRR